MPLNGVAIKYYQRTQTVDATTDTEIISATDQYDVDTVTLSVKNGDASTAFDACKLDFKVHPDSAWVNVETSGWATADNIVLTTYNFATLAGATEAIMRFKTEGIYAWRLLANANTSALGPVTVWGIGTGVEKVIGDCG